MAKYMIHAVPKRMWYVNDYLIPSMLKQGISEDDITVYNDENKLGNLKACLDSFKLCEEGGGTWHLQDDIIISSKFKEQTEEHDSGIVCGFCSYYDGEKRPGMVGQTLMWLSFPCIRIPNKIAREFVEWMEQYCLQNPVYRDWWRRGMYDDWWFQHYINDYYKHERILNLAPNIVNHIDYLIGGSTTNSNRDEPAVSRHWLEDNLVEELKCSLLETK